MTGDGVFGITPGDENIIRGVAKVFFNNYSRYLEEIKRAIEGKDADMLEFTAHTIKGTLAIFQSNLAVQSAFKLEKMGRENNLAQAKKVCGVLGEQVDNLIMRLKEFVDSKDLEKKILIVEDSIEQSTFLENSLKKCGFKVFVASDGLEAMEAVRKLKLDIILLDLHLPKMNGLEFLKEIKKIGLSSDTNVIITSSDKRLKLGKIALKLGASDYILKPFSIGRLTDKIVKFCQSTKKMKTGSPKRESKAKHENKKATEEAAFNYVAD